MDQMKQTRAKRWLDLSEAADLLGVHFTTVRRWADAGQLPCIRTPGGRRRFAAGDLQAFLEHARQAATPAALVPLETRTLDVARQQLHHSPGGGDRLMARFGEEQRNRFRYSGQRLLGLLIQYGSRNDSGEAFLEQATRLAAEYGAICAEAGLTVSETVQTFLFFGHRMMDAVQHAGSLSGPYDAESHRLYQRMNEFLDAVMVATIESYCHPEIASPTPAPEI
jgi:excisionase family DNA binding protein